MLANEVAVTNFTQSVLIKANITHQLCHLRKNCNRYYSVCLSYLNSNIAFVARKKKRKNLVQSNQCNNDITYIFMYMYIWGFLYVFKADLQSVALFTMFRYCFDRTDHAARVSDRNVLHKTVMAI